MDQKIISLYDQYTHTPLERRVFLKRLARLAGGTAAALALLPLLENDYARAQLVAADDERIDTGYITYPGASGEVRGYLARPRGEGRSPGVVVIHENRGLNPHIEDVARRAAVAGFLALAPDALSPAGGTPADQDRARTMIRGLDRAAAIGDFIAAVSFLEGHSLATGKVGCVGFCWGGGMVNQLAVRVAGLDAAVAFYGRQPADADVAAIRAPVMLHYAGLDDRINAGIADYERALEAAAVDYRLHIYDGVNHAFHNDTNGARYDEAAARLAWRRTIEFFQQNLRNS